MERVALLPSVVRGVYVSAWTCDCLWTRDFLAARDSETACGRVRQRGDVARACVKRCVEVENRDTYEGYGCIHSRQQRKNVHQPWPLAT